MTVSVPGQLVYSYSGDGSTQIFSYPVRFLDEAELVVVLEASDGTQTVKTLTTHYTVSGAGEANGGSVTMLTAPAAGETLYIYRSTAATQSVDLTDNNRSPAATVEEQLDRFALGLQDLKEAARRTYKTPAGERDKTIEVVAEGHFLKADASGNLVDGGSATDISEAQTNAAAAAASASAAASSATAAASSATAAASSATDASTSATEAAASAASIDPASIVHKADTDASTFGFVVDEDDMASDSATKLPTQQSVNQGKLQKVATRTAMKALSGTTHPAVYSFEDERDGPFNWKSGDFSAEVAADTQEGRVVASANVAATIGAWHRPRSRAYFMTDFGMDPTGGSASAAAFQAMLDYITTLGGGEVCDIPGGGSYLLDSQVTATDVDLTIRGIEQERTRFLVNNTTGGISFTSTGRTGTAHRFGIEGATFVSQGSGAVARGKALSIVYPAVQPAPATPCFRAENLNFRGMAYTVDPTASPYFTDGLYVKNAHNSRILDVCSNQNSNDQFTAINLDYDHNAQAFMMRISGANLEGGLYGIKMRGWLEDLQISGFEIAAPRYAINLDASAADVAPPLVIIERGHVNGSSMALIAKRLSSVHVSDVNAHIEANSASDIATLYGMRFESIQYLTVSGGNINSLINSPAAIVTHVNLMSLLAVTDFSVNGITGLVNYNASIRQNAITVTNASQFGRIAGNTLRSTSSANDTAVLLQPNVGSEEGIIVEGNLFENFGTGVQHIDLKGGAVRNNKFIGTTTPLLSSGTPGAALVVEGNEPAASTTITGNDTTPSVAGVPNGALVISNTAATTITQFDDGREGQTIQIRAGNANTTISHNTNILLQGGTNFAMASGNMLWLRRANSIWRELSRLT